MLDVLNLEWMSYPSRDRNVASMVCNYLRYQGVTCREESIHNGYRMIDKYHPRLLFMTNTTGASINFEILKYATRKGVKVVSLVSEGNYKDDINALPYFLWGNNTDQIMYEDENLQWSERTRNMVVSSLPELSSKLKVCGSCGVDIYKIRNNFDKQQFLEKYKKGYFKKVIGIGCWDFSHCYEDGGAYQTSLELFGKPMLERFKKDRDSFNNILIRLVNANPDVLFLVKEHPGNTKGVYMSGAAGLEDKENVLILKKESIVDCIMVSDIWVVYESTTVFEAWMSGKQTCLLNPSGIDFPRANVYLGSPNFSTYKEFQQAIDTFYEKGTLPGYAEKEMERLKIISETVQWDDGLNHVRAGNEIIKVLKEPSKKKNMPMSLEYRLKALKINLINWLHYTRSTYYKKRVEFNHIDLDKYNSELFKYQLEYYKSKGLSKEDLSEIKVLD